MANNKYDSSTRKKVIRLHLEEGRTVKSLTEEYSLGSGTLQYWLNKHREECKTDTKLQNETEILLENQRLRKELAEAKKENDFLKRRQHSSRRKSTKNIQVY